MGKRDRTHEMSWMEKVRKRLRDEITSVKEFSIAVETLERETRKRKLVFKTSGGRS